MASCAELLTPLYDLMVKRVLLSLVVHTDDTTVPVLDPALPQTRTGRFYKSGLYPVFSSLNRRLVRWARKKYKRYRHQRRATHWLRGLARRQPGLFAHWELGAIP